MPRVNAEVVLDKVVGKLLRDRQKLVAKIAKLTPQLEAIDKLFARYHIAAPAAGKAKGAAKAAGKAKGKRGKGKRGRFSTTGEASVLAFIKANGKPTTAEVNKHWAAEGRGGLANNTLTKMVKAKVLKRIDDPAVRGSRYALA